jgi:hypothetical protein
VNAALKRAIRFYSTQQTHDGHFAGDYGGPMFLMPGLVRLVASQGETLLWCILVQEADWIAGSHGMDGA